MVQLQSALAAGNLDGLPGRLAQIKHQASAARSLTSDPIWSALGDVPWFGASLDAAQRMALSIDQVAGQVLPPLVKATDAIAPRTMRSADGTLKLGRLTSAIPDLKVASQALESAQRTLDKSSGSGVFTLISHSRAQLGKSLAGLAGSLDSAYRAAQIAPAMVGANGARRYLVIFQTPAESRGTGGLAGSYAVIRFDQGKLTTERSGSDADFKSSPVPVVDLGQEYRDRYGQTGGASEWSAANWTPNFPWAAEVWSKLWERQSGQRIDGVISVDPIALGDFLNVTGPVTLSDGEVITGANAAQWVMSDSYRVYPTNQTLRRQVSTELSKRVLNRLSSDQTDLTALLKVMGKAAGERRLLLWSAHPAEEKLISGTPAAGEESAAPGPYADLILRNGAGDKLDYYLDRSLDYHVLSCSAAARMVRVSFTLMNTAPTSGLPAYVTGRVDGRVVPVGQDRVYADLFLARGAVLKSWKLDGSAVPVRLSIELGHSVAEFDLELPLGEARTVTAVVQEPPSKKRVLIPVQPLARPLRVTSSGSC